MDLAKRIENRLEDQLKLKVSENVDGLRPLSLTRIVSGEGELTDG